MHDLYPLFFFAILIVLIAEGWCWKNFIPSYFRCGIPLLQTKQKVEGTIGLPEAHELEVGEGHYLPFAAKRIGENAFGLRERVRNFTFQVYYTPVMHGSVCFDPDGKQVTITGFANATPVLLLALVASATGTAGLAVGGMLYALLYGIQVKRYLGMLKHAARFHR